jgi:hypothetical protein
MSIKLCVEYLVEYCQEHKKQLVSNALSAFQNKSVSALILTTWNVLNYIIYMGMPHRMLGVW